MNIQELSPAIQRTRPYLERFTSYDYPKAFEAYETQFSSAFAQAAREADDPAALAGALLDEVESGWKHRHFWERGAVRVDEKRMLTVYLTPMLLRGEEPRCTALAEALQVGWRNRWPDDPYETASYEELRGGFRRVILGIELPDREERRKKDR